MLRAWAPGLHVEGKAGLSLPVRALQPRSALLSQALAVPGTAEEASVFPALLPLLDMGLLGHRCFISRDRGGGDFITLTRSSLKRLESLPFPEAVLAER